MSIKCAADFADWYDQDARNFADEVLTDFVQEHPNFFAVAVAGVVSSQIDFASVFLVDLARLGTGTAEGSASGVFQDLLRVLSVVPIGKVTAVGRPLIGRIVQGLSNRFYWRTIRGNSCVPISIGQALQFTGQRLLVRLEDVANALGRQVASFKFEGSGASVPQARNALNELNAQFDELASGVAQSWGDIVMYAEATEGVLLVPLRRTLTGIGDKFHMVMVAKTPQGVQIFDRAGVFNSLDDLSRSKGSKNLSEFYGISTDDSLLVIKNWVLDPALANQLNALGPLGAVAVKVAMEIGFNPSVPSESIAKAFREHVANEESLYPPPTQPPEMVSLMGTHTVEGPRIEKRDWLSSIAGEYYGDVLLWPILFDFNKGPDFTNQNKMYVGQRVKVPFIDDKTPEEIAEYRKRGLNWR